MPTPRRCKHGIAATLPCPKCKGGVAKAAKYGAIETEVDGIRFASRKEARRYSELRLMERAGEISYLRRQVVFAIHVNGVLVCRYIADFTYRTKDNPAVIVEDCKGKRTATYQIKKKLMKAVHEIEIKET